MAIKAEMLIAIASAHGTDLERAAKMASREKPKPDVIPGKRKGSRVLIPPPKNRVKGSETRTMQRPAWSSAEIGQAAAGLPEAPFRAALYAFAGAQEHFDYLRTELYGRAKMFQRLYSWPDRVRDFHGISCEYILHLCGMVLDEDAHLASFKAVPGMYWMYMRVTDETWEKQLKPRYVHLAWAWNDWLGHAARVIQSKLSENE